MTDAKHEIPAFLLALLMLALVQLFGKRPPPDDPEDDDLQRRGW